MQLFKHTIRWIGFFATTIMLVLSFLDPSGDEYLIHFIASIIPITLSWAIIYLIEK
ncbi:hypothetical protein N8720_03965 [Candidatus Marinimicrobia bacterium]|nr:hypothetical protein [Candidatus Neomarinimicrobiota bacterium]